VIFELSTVIDVMAFKIRGGDSPPYHRVSEQHSAF